MQKKQDGVFSGNADAGKFAGYLRLSLEFRQACLNFVDNQRFSQATHSKEAARRYKALLAGAEHLYDRAFGNPDGAMAGFMKTHPSFRKSVAENAFLKKSFSEVSASMEAMMGCVAHARSVVDYKDSLFEDILKDRALTDFLAAAHPRVFEGICLTVGRDLQKKPQQGQSLAQKTRIAMSVWRDPEVIPHLPEESVEMLDQKSSLKRMYYLFFFDAVEEHECQKRQHLKAFEARLGLS